MCRTCPVYPTGAVVLRAVPVKSIGIVVICVCREVAPIKGTGLGVNVLNLT